MNHDELPNDTSEQDAHTYQMLYGALSTPPSSELSSDFAQKVAECAIPNAPKARPEYFTSTTLWIALALVFSLTATYYIQVTLFEQLLRQVIHLKEVVIFSIFALALIQLSDYWFVKTKRLSR